MLVLQPGDLRLNIWLDHETDVRLRQLHYGVGIDIAVQGNKYRVTAYDSIITVVEPETSWFDFKTYVAPYLGHERRLTLYSIGSQRTLSLLCSSVVSVTTPTLHSFPNPRRRGRPL